MKQACGRVHERYIEYERSGKKKKKGQRKKNEVDKETCERK